MTTSYNGFDADPNPDAINVKTFQVPGIAPTIRLRIRSEVAPVILALAADFHRTVDRLDNRIVDDWGYAYREIRGGGPLSCHASGTAIDLNATKYPMGRSNMSARQVAAVRALLKKYRVIRWGGDFGGSRVDQMHFEIAPGKTLADVRDVIRDLGLASDGSTTPPAEFPGHPIKKGDRGPVVKTIQRALRLPVDGIYGQGTEDAVRAFEKRRPWLGRPDGIVTRRTYDALLKRL